MKKKQNSFMYILIILLLICTILFTNVALSYGYEIIELWEIK